MSFWRFVFTVAVILAATAAVMWSFHEPNLGLYTGLKIAIALFLSANAIAAITAAIIIVRWDRAL